MFENILNTNKDANIELESFCACESTDCSTDFGLLLFYFCPVYIPIILRGHGPGVENLSENNYLTELTSLSSK